MDCVPSNPYDPIGSAKQLPDQINTRFCWTIEEMCFPSWSHEKVIEQMKE
jgi:hypothetical protein